MRQINIKASMFLALFLFGCSHDVKMLDSADIEDINGDNLLIVDCLLPSSVRSLGTRITYLGPRRVIKTSAIDCRIRGGEYVAADRANYQTALKVWLPLAQAGDVQAQTYVGEIYDKGLGTKPDFAKAREWYEKAASRGDSRAKMNLGYLYESGKGVKRDITRAMNLYRDASGLKQGNLEYVSSVQIAQRREQQAENQRLNQEIAQSRRALQSSNLVIDSLKKELQGLNRQLANSRTVSSHETQQIQYRINRKQVALRKHQSNANKASRELNNVVKLKSVETDNTSTRTESESIPAPSIEITSPPVSATRSAHVTGKTAITLSSNVSSTVIKGNVSPVGTIKTLRINGAPTSFDKQGEFSREIPVGKQGSEVTILATNNQGKETELGFILVPGQEGSSFTPAEAPQTNAASLKDLSFGRYFALVIGNNNYEQLPDLKSSQNDARAVANLLASKYGFRSILVTDARRGKMLGALNSLRKKLKENDNLLIYYAGHGQIDSEGKGYWQPVDALKDNPYSWISNRQISQYLDTIPAKHILVVADSCYSGTMSRTAIPRPSGSGARQVEWYQKVLKSRVRVVLSSGDVKPVLDIGGKNNHSVFASAFLKALKENPRLMEASRLYRSVKNKVRDSASKQGIEQIPQYSPIQYAGHIGGDFFLVDKSGNSTASVSEEDIPDRRERFRPEADVFALETRHNITFQEG